MFAGLELTACHDLAVPTDIMQHVVNVESSRNPYAIGVVGGELERQPRTLDEAVATARMLEQSGHNYSLGIAQVNRSNLSKFGLDTYEKAFDYCANLSAGSKILAECHSRAGGDWGKAFSCYYSGNFRTGFRDGYVHRVYASISKGTPAIAVMAKPRAPVTVRAEPLAHDRSGLNGNGVFLAQVREPADQPPPPEPESNTQTLKGDAADLRHGPLDAAFVF
jgi:type IV secretion system protein VirB1